MRHEWDEAKRAADLDKHGVDFAAILGFDWPTALVRADTRKDYGEARPIAIGGIAGRIHVLVFTIERRAVRLISLRRASRKEILIHAAERASARPPLADR